MRTIAVSIIRNEADILETFVRYHLQMIERMIVINHRSVDLSPQILRSLKQEGLNLELDEDTSLDQPQSRALTCAMKRAARDLGADWVLPLDADEFLAVSDGGTVREAIESFPVDRVIRIPWRTYIPMPSDDVDEFNVLKRITHCRRAEHHQIFKVLVPAPLARRRRVALGFGSHQLSRRTVFGPRESPSVETDRLVLAHFPVRSGSQVATKAIMGWLACLARSDRSRKDNYHLKRIYDRFREGNPIGPEELSSMALVYAAGQRPVDTEVAFSPIRPERGDFVLRYGTESQCDPLAVLAQMGEEFAQAFGSIRRTSFLAGTLLRRHHDRPSKDA